MDTQAANLRARAHQALLHGLLAHQEDVRRLGDAQAEYGAQSEGHAAFHREGGVAAGEDEAQAVVVDGVGHRLLLCCLRRGFASCAFGGAVLGLRAAQRVNRAVLGDGRQPRTGVVWDAPLGPRRQRPRHGVVKAVFGEIPVTRRRDQARDDAQALLSGDRGERGAHLGRDAGGVL